MINSKIIQNCKTSFPAVQTLTNDMVLGKIHISGIYQGWKGENIEQIKQKHKDNPYTLRIGMPSVDKQLKADPVLFILHYLSYNPLSKDIEKRELIPYRNMDKIYVGQSIDEQEYTNFKAFFDGNVIADELFLKRYDDIAKIPVGKILQDLMSKVQKLEKELALIKRQSTNNPIYNKQRKNEQFS
jgi:hypothetical protein